VEAVAHAADLPRQARRQRRTQLQHRRWRAPRRARARGRVGHTGEEDRLGLLRGEAGAGGCGSRRGGGSQPPWPSSAYTGTPAAPQRVDVPVYGAHQSLQLVGDLLVAVSRPRFCSREQDRRAARLARTDVRLAAFG
jgi:hypothetical protein